MLEKLPLFYNMTTHELDEIEKIIRQVSLFRGEFVFKRGEISKDFYIIQSGLVELSHKDVFQENKSVAMLSNGDFFGEMALFDKAQERSLDAQVLQNTVLLQIPGDKFEKLLSDSPGMSFKVMAALSKRLKEANEQRGAVLGDSDKKTDGKIVVIASPRNGYGKTTLSTTLVSLLAQESAKKILYIDLDLYFGDGTFALGVFSPKSILAFTEKFKDEPPIWDSFLKYLVRHKENLFVLPAPKDFIEGEKVNFSDFAAILKTSRSFFDFIIIDTDSSVSEVFLTAVELADQILFLVNVQTMMSIKSDVRYFRGISHLNLPPERCGILVTRAGESFAPEQISKLIDFKVIGILPQITTLPMDYGQSVYNLARNGTYCETLRAIFKSLFKITWLPGQTGNGFFHNLFNPTEPGQKPSLEQPGEIRRPTGCLEIANVNSGTLLSFIRASMTRGYWDKAFTEAMELLEIFPDSPPILLALGEICFNQKNYQLGIDALQRALNQDPQNHYAMGALGAFQMNKEMMGRSLEILAQKIQKTPDFPDLYNDLGKLSFAFKDYPKAEKAFKKALELNPGFDEAIINLAISFAAAGEIPRAIEYLIRAKNKNIRINYLLGDFHFSMGDFMASYKAYSKVATENSQYLEVSEKLDSLRNYFKKISNLLRRHQEKIRDYPDFPDLHCTTGNLLILLGKHDEARLEFQRALELNPRYLEASSSIEKIAALTARLHLTTDPEKGSDDDSEKFTFEINLLKEDSGASRYCGSFPNYLISLKNIRTNKTVAGEIPVDDLQTSVISFDCQTIGPVVLEDILLVQLMDNHCRIVFATLVHVVTEEELLKRTVKLSLSPLSNPAWHYSLDVHKDLRLPVRYFCVRIICQQLSSLITGANPPVKAEIKNPGNGAVARGTSNVANPDETYFVLKSTNGTDVVVEGDMLHIELSDRQGSIIFSLDFPVLSEDVDEFCKTITVSFLEHLLQSKVAQISKPEMVA